MKCIGEIEISSLSGHILMEKIIHVKNSLSVQLEAQNISCVYT